MALPGYCIGDLIEDAGFLEANERAMQRIAEAARGITAIVGFIDFDSRRATTAARSGSTTPRRSCATASVLQRAHKTLLPNYRYFDDKRFFVPGDEREPVDVPVQAGTVRARRLDLRRLLGRVLRRQAAAGARRARAPTCSSTSTRRRSIRESGTSATSSSAGTSRQLRKPLVYVNTAGAADNGKNIIPFDGESLVYDADWTADRDRPPVRGGAAHRRSRPGRARLRDCRCRRSNAIARCTTALVMALRDYMRKTGFTRATVAVSGGIDSALALAIAVDALGPDRVTAYNMPSKFNTETTRSIAERLARALGVATASFRFRTSTTTCAPCSSATRIRSSQSLTRENLHARIRGLLMMAESNDTGALLISCGNETEIALGYATLYGDMCGGMSLIGDLSKTRRVPAGAIRQRKARHREDPRGAFHIIPSAELADGPVRPVRLLRSWRRRRRARRAAHEPGRARQPVRAPRARSDAVPAGRGGPDGLRQAHGRVVPRGRRRRFRRIRRSVYKRLQGPPIVVVTERAFGFDLRETIINGWEG